jgi:hypothetical protein
MTSFAADGTPLTQDGVTTAAGVLGAGVPELWAVISVETSGFGFLPDRRPKILFERHIFHRLTGGRYDATNPDISQPTAGGYGAAGNHQYDRLAVAEQLDAAAALQSASWGLGQVLGENFSSVGFADPADMVAAMVAAEDRQLAAMAAFIDNNGLAPALRQHDWTALARGYNGPDYAAHNYNGLLQRFYGMYSTGPAPDLTVRAAQVYLTYKGFSPGGVDGINGPNTIAAVKRFQASAGLPQTGVIDDALLALLSAP